MSEVVFALDCEMVIVMRDGKRKLAAGHVVLVKSDPKYGIVKVLDTYIHYKRGFVASCNTRYSHIESWMLNEGIPIETAIYFILRMVRGHTLVTFGGKADLDALGITEAYVMNFAAKYIDIQQYTRPDGKPYGLGPLVEYFDYRTRGLPVLINHYCVEDATYTLRLYLDHWRDPAGNKFEPTSPIRTVKEFKLWHGLQ